MPQPIANVTPHKRCSVDLALQAGFVGRWRQGRSYQWTADHGFDSRKALPPCRNAGTSGERLADVLKIA